MSSVSPFRKTMRAALAEPTLHFVLIGSLLFVGLQYVASQRGLLDDATSEPIVVSRVTIAALREDWLRSGRPEPTRAQLDAIVNDHVTSEVLYREALGLGLDRGDIVVKRRLAQKMQFLLEGASPVPAPSEADLQAFLDAHRARFDEPPEVRISHIFVSADEHGERTEAIALEILRKIDAGAVQQPDNAGSYGDVFPEGRDLPMMNESRLARVFGPTFARAAMGLSEGGWSAPIPSAYGMHLVRCHERKETVHVTVDQVRDELTAAWRREQQREAYEDELNTLLTRYQVSITDE